MGSPSKADDFRAVFACRFREIPRPFGVDRLGFYRILFAVVDLQHRAIQYDIRLRIVDALVDSLVIRDIEITVFQCKHLMFTRQSCREVVADKSGRAGNDNLHRA